MRTIPLFTFSSVTAVVIVCCLLTGCGKDDSSGDDWGGTRNATGFPDIGGQYSFNTSEITWSGSDGSSGSGPPIAMNVVIQQTDNTFKVFNSGGGSIIAAAGVTIITDSGLTGNVDKNGQFIATETMRVTIDGIDGTVLLHYTLNGTFTPSGWSGDYRYSMSVDAYSLVGNYQCTFTGDKIIPMGKVVQGQQTGKYDSSSLISFALFFGMNASTRDSLVR